MSASLIESVRGEYTLPDVVDQVSVSGTSATGTATALGSGSHDITGRVVWFRASGANVTLMLGTQTVTAGKGVYIADGSQLALFIPDNAATISYVASAAGTLYFAFQS